MERKKCEINLQVGKYYRTRGGERAFVAATHKKSPFNEIPYEEYCVYGYIEGRDVPMWWTVEGAELEDDAKDSIVSEWTEPRRRIKGFVNLYANPEFVVRYGESSRNGGAKGLVHASREEADRMRLSDQERVACIEIDVLEGEGLEGASNG